MAYPELDFQETTGFAVEHARARHDWAKEHLRGTDEQWELGVFTDEASVELENSVDGSFVHQVGSGKRR